MNEKFAYELQGNLLFLYVKDNYSAQEFLDFLKNALSDSRLPPGFGIIIDARRSKAVRRISDLQAIEFELNKWKARIARIAVVVESDMHFGFIRQSSVYAEFDGREVAPFRDMESAIDWVKKKLE